AFVQDVRDVRLQSLAKLLQGQARSTDGQQLFQELANAGITSAQRETLTKLLIYAVDLVLAESLSFVEYHVTIENLQIVVSDCKWRDEEGGGASYRLEPTDMIAVEYCSGEGTWVDKYARVKA